MTGPAEEPAERSARAHEELAATPGLRMHGDEQVVIVLYDGFTALDAVGPHYMLASMMGATVHLLTTGAPGVPVVSDLGLAVAPTGTLDDVPDQVDVLLVPGGSAGTAAAMRDERLLTWLARTGERAGLVCGVCTGSVVLGRAGLLRGHRATAHWVARDLLAGYGAEPVDERVVADGRVITAAGVTAGIDLGLHVVARLRGRPYAAAVELQAEYAPQPLCGTGTPAAAGPELTDRLRDLFAPLLAAMDSAGNRIASPDDTSG